MRRRDAASSRPVSSSRCEFQQRRKVFRRAGFHLRQDGSRVAGVIQTGSRIEILELGWRAVGGGSSRGLDLACQNFRIFSGPVVARGREGERSGARRLTGTAGHRMATGNRERRRDVHAGGVADGWPKGAGPFFIRLDADASGKNMALAAERQDLGASLYPAYRHVLVIF